MSIDPNQVQIAFLAAVEIKDASARKALLDRLCTNNAELRQRVEELLAAHDQSGSFLNRPLAADGELDLTVRSNSDSDAPNTIIGPYKLLQQIGEGGMGVVYMAEQQKPVRRRVALKIIKPGMDSRQVIARFEAERQALAMMDHPNIARVLDAGCTENGRPYFAMELVQGIPITKYCDDKQLSPQERLELFIEVCHAVQHAHQKGIIHRDLKPSNVLVSIYDGKPMPKIIDFGVAKALHQRLTEKTMFTQFGAVVGTLEYMSPEQADMDVVGTDTRSDIYSLGVLLYELLTGSTPLDSKKLRSLGYAEMVKAIREVDPPKPSTRLSQSAHDLENISAKRHTEPKRLQKLVAGDLDWIVMKCLEKDRARRYETANGLALDIQRHLHDEAVSASPPGQLYKLQKMVRRNKLVCAAAASVMLALLLGMAASLWQAGRAAREAARAQQEANRASAALNDLQAAAPSIAAEARALAAKEKFDEAIDKLEYAAKLRPDVPEYLLAKADLLETQMQLFDAAAVYRAALKLDPENARAKQNADLCDQLAAAPKSEVGKLTRESLSKLSAQMEKDQRSAAEIMAIARVLGEEKKYILSYWQDRLKDLPVGTETPLEKRLSVGKEGLLSLDLRGTSIADLSPLVGMPLGELDLTGSQKLADLAPLRGMPLLRLYLSGATKVSSLESLRGMSSLETLQFNSTPVSDLAPLQGLRIRQLKLSGSDVTSLEPLRGMPIEELAISATSVKDLAPLKGMPLKEFEASGIEVRDFTPLRGLPLESCALIGTDVGDLDFLRDAPLKELYLWNSKVHNLAVLSEIHTLERLLLPVIAGDIPVKEFTAIENLRSHPSLKQISLWVTSTTTTANLRPTDDFWKGWDRDYAWALRLRKAGVVISRWYRNPDFTSRLFLEGQRFSDLSLLKGAAITELGLNGAGVTDLTPLKSMPLTWLMLDNNSVSDLSPLRGMKLTYLGLYNTRVRDLSPLAEMPLIYMDLRSNDQLTDVSPLAKVSSLERLTLPARVTDLDSLRNLTNLKYLSFSLGNSRPTCTTELFWKTWDGLPWARKLDEAKVAFTFEQLASGYYDVRIHDPKFTDCSIFKDTNVRRLDLDRSGVSDLNTLAELPLTSLWVRETAVTDLSPLRSTVLANSLRELRMWKNKVTDFSPIAACTKLETFDTADTRLTDLSIFKGMKLHALHISRTPVTDISVLAGMPLESLHLSDTHVTDLSPLLQCPTLVSIVLSKETPNIDLLRTLPKLARISYNANSRTDGDTTAAEFWAEYRPEEPWMAALRKATVTYKNVRLTDSTWDVKLSDPKFSDLSLLKGAPIGALTLSKTGVTDLGPLGNLAIETLDLRETKISDLSALRTAPLRNSLKQLYLWKTSVTDFSPLAECKNLEYFDASDTALESLEAVRGRKLRVLRIARTKVSDLSALAGMPLEEVNLVGTPITDISPLLTCQTLKSLVLPEHVRDIATLRKLPGLVALSYESVSGGAPKYTAAKFWEDYDLKQK